MIMMLPDSQYMCYLPCFKGAKRAIDDAPNNLKIKKHTACNIGKGFKHSQRCTTSVCHIHAPQIKCNVPQ